MFVVGFGEEFSFGEGNVWVKLSFLRGGGGGGDTRHLSSFPPSPSSSYFQLYYLYF